MGGTRLTARIKGLLEGAGLFVLSGALFSAGPAFGQSATDQATAETAATADTLQEVVVTAERRAENVQTTPISVVAISGDALQAASVTTINDLVQVAPDVTIQSGNGSSAINIRGIGIEPVGLAEAGVVVVRDGIANITAGIGNDIPYYDMADVEVLRGPQGTFAGDNSTGGAIIINSQNPNFRGINGYVTAKVGTYSDAGLQGAVNLPVSDTLAMRLAVNAEERNSFFHDEGASFSSLEKPYFIPGKTNSATSGNKTVTDPGNLNNKDIRLSLLWKPTDNFQALTKIEFDNNDTDGLPTQPNINTFAPIGGFCPSGHGTAPNCVALYTQPGYSGSPYTLNSWLLSGAWDEHIALFSEELRYTLPDGIVARVIGGDEQMYYITASNSTGDAIDNQGGVPNVSYPSYNTVVEEADLISPTTGKLSWVAGEIYSRSPEEFGTTFTTNTAFPYSVAAPQHTFWANGGYFSFKAWGVFGQTTWQMTNTLQLQVGARLGWDIEQGNGIFEIYRTGLTPLYGYALDSRDDKESPQDDWTPSGKIGLNWQPTKNQYFYAFWAHGYKPGLGNLSGPPTTKEWVNDTELGWKGTLANGHVLTDVGAYLMQYYQMIESTFNPYAVVAASNDVNLSPSTVKGIEASMQSRFGHFGFDISADYNKSALGSATTARTYAFPSNYGITNQCGPGQTPDARNSNCTNYGPYLVTLSGESLPFSPLFQGNATLRYDIPLANSMTLEPRVTYSYTGKQYASLFQIPFYEEPAHGLMNAYLDWNAGPWTTTLFSTNVTNKLYVTSLTATSEYFGNPRQYGLQVTRTF